MLEQMVAYFTSWFANPSILGISLALVFGTIWLAPYWTPILKKPWAWAVLVSSALLTLVAVAFIQIPLQSWAAQALNYFWGKEVILRWLLLAGIPFILISGLVQEGSKLVPVIIYWWRKDRNIDPKLGLAIGAIAGMGFGIFEAQWVHNTAFVAGWNWDWLERYGVVALAPFWERFFTVAFHTASTALAGYGLARGWGWQFYLLASFLHAFLNYSLLFQDSELLSTVQGEIFIAVVAVLVISVTLWLRWRKSAETAELEVSLV